MGIFKNAFLKWLGFRPAQQRAINVMETLTHADQLMVNRVWYRGDPAELSQLYKSMGYYYGNESRFWAVVPPSGQSIRKIHTGLPQLIIDMLNDITNDDFLGINFGNDENENVEAKTVWDEIAKENKFDEIRKEATGDMLIDGDGAFKVTIDTGVSKYPIIEFYTAELVDYTYDRGRLKEYIFHTYYNVNEKTFRLDEVYGKGYINYKLYNDHDVEVPLDTLPETADLVDVTFQGDFIMAVQLKMAKSSKFKNRGKGILETKYDTLDALDETVSEWLDAIRLGRPVKLIPDELIPRDVDGNKIPLNPILNTFVTYPTPRSMSDDDKKTAEVVQPQIDANSYLSSYIQYLDMALMGIISPSTLGIDVKKLDNGEAQREKEKATMYTRNKIINALENALPELVRVTMMTYDLMQGKAPGEYEPSIEFGEYANPSFEAVVETVSKAYVAKIMSVEKVVDELYGDSLTEEEKELEIERIKEQHSLSTGDGMFGGMDQYFDIDEGEEQPEDPKDKEKKEEDPKKDDE